MENKECYLALYNLGDCLVNTELFLCILHDYEQIGFNVISFQDHFDKDVFYKYLVYRNEVIYFGYVKEGK